MPLMEMDDMTCAELVELVTEYLEDTLAPGERRPKACFAPPTELRR